jgi:hypothetical protein
LSEPVVKEAEERALANTVAADVEERVDALIKQLEEPIAMAFIHILPLVSSFLLSFRLIEMEFFHQR